MSGSIYIDKQNNGLTESLRLGDLNQLTIDSNHNVYGCLLLLSASNAMPLFTAHGSEVVGAIFDYQLDYLTGLLGPGNVDCVSGSQFADFVVGGYFWMLRTGSS